jgi:hypothetical protein
MKHGCLVISGLGLVSLFVFGVTLEAVNNPKELTAIPFTPWDFVTYGLITFAILLLICILRRPDLRKTLVGRWTSNINLEGSRLRTTLHLDPGGSAEICTKRKVHSSQQRLRSNVRWQLLDDKTLYLCGSQPVTCKILKLNRWSMIMATPTDSGYSIRWIKYPKVNTKACFLVALAILLPILLGLFLLRSQPSHIIADDPQYVPSNSLPHTHR